MKPLLPGPGLKRRTLLKSAAAGALLPTAGCAAFLDRAAAGLPTREAVWDDQLRLNALGPRYTGNEAHLRLIEWMSAELERIGLRVLNDDRRFARWSVRSASLALGPQREPVEITSVYPYSASTGAEAVEARLVHGGSASNPDPGVDLSGRIVFLEAPPPVLPFSDWYSNPRLYGRAREFPATVSHAAAQVVSAPDLSSFAQRGARGVILGWTGISEAHAAGQYLPFNRPLQPIPGLWVGPAAAARLAAAARPGETIRLRLDADIDPSGLSRTIYAELPGSTSETLIVNTHTDGPNAVEENGPIGLVALARRLAALDRSERRRSVMFLMASGHFVGPQLPSTDGFIAEHPDILQRSVAALAVEHLGAMEWADQPGRGYAPTGRPELSYLFTQDSRLAELALAVSRAAGDPRGAIAHPEDAGHFFGEGRPLSRAGVPTLGFIPIPSYLLSSAADGHIGKLDPQLMHVQIGFMAALLDRLLTFPFAPASPSVALRPPHLQT